MFINSQYINITTKKGGLNKMDKQEEKRFRNLLKKQNKNKLINECVLLYKQANKFYKEITIKKLKQIND